VLKCFLSARKKTKQSDKFESPWKGTHISCCMSIPTRHTNMQQSAPMSCREFTFYLSALEPRSRASSRCCCRRKCEFTCCTSHSSFYCRARLNRNPIFIATAIHKQGHGEKKTQQAPPLSSLEFWFISCSARHTQNGDLNLSRYCWRNKSNLFSLLARTNKQQQMCSSRRRREK
jgi:hypothetical protein